MKKVVSILVILLLVFVVGCSSKNEEKVIKLGIIQIVEHPSLDNVRTGFLKRMNELGYVEGKNLIVDYQNAQGDQANLKMIANKLSKESDMVLAIATPSAQAIAQVNKEIPIIISAITDPIAAGLVETLEKPNTNVTGTVDAIDLEKQFSLFKKMNDVKTIGLIYNASEANSKAQVEEAKIILNKEGYKVEEVTISTTNDIKISLTSLVKKVDALYIPIDNTVASAMASVQSIAIENKIPVVAASIEQVQAGGLVTYGIDYSKLGAQTADMSDKIIKGANIKEMPIEKISELELFINENNAKKLNIDPSIFK